ncbi:MAG: restriction endonuclease subunit R [Bacteroidetes bacterium]|nr:MAG: restriction endonuclease subunit R [Bacteroidota bacterium]
MEKLELPEYQFKIKTSAGKKEIFDRIRKKYVVLTPEEWVRQNFIAYLVEEKNYPASLISVETGLKLFKVKKRSDILIYQNTGKPIMIVECKAAKVKIDQNVFDQIARYNMALKVNYLVVTNGLSHYCCLLDYENNSYQFIENIPEYSSLLPKP